MSFSQAQQQLHGHDCEPCLMSVQNSHLPVRPLGRKPSLGKLVYWIGTAAPEESLGPN